MVVNHDIKHVPAKPRRAFERLKPEFRVLAQYSHLVVIKPRRLFQDCNRHPGLADVVDHAGKRQAVPVRLRKAEMLAECHGHTGHKQAMLIGLAVMLADRVDPRF